MDGTFLKLLGQSARIRTGQPERNRGLHHKRVFRSCCSCSAKSAVGFLPKGDQPSPQPCSVRSAGRQAAPTRTTALAREASQKGTDLANSLARKAGQEQARFASGLRCLTAFPPLAESYRGKKRLQLYTFHLSHIHDQCPHQSHSHNITLQHEIRTLFVCASQREVQDSACRGNLLDNLQRARRTWCRT